MALNNFGILKAECDDNMALYLDPKFFVPKSFQECEEAYILVGRYV